MRKIVIGAFVTPTYERAGAVTTGSFVPDEPSAAELERRKNLK